MPYLNWINDGAVDFDDPAERNEKLAELLSPLWRNYAIRYVVRLPLEDPEPHDFDPADDREGWRIYFD
ncbi:MAG TPA: hypothetical protein VKE69_07340 [Planctomycetota bacterium]|nr:hypothetical protein [Planctomycetota bacterium]